MGKDLVAYFFEREDAEEVARRLAADDLTVRRERFHGEDDDEDHPWTLVLPPDIDPVLAEELITRYDGWLQTSSQSAPPRTPPPLPTAPRRGHREQHGDDRSESAPPRRRAADGH